MGDSYNGSGPKDRMSGGVVYIGGLSDAVKKEDLEKEFKDCGKMKSVWVAFNPPGFAFIEFENPSDAEDACFRYNGTEMLGSKIKVEMSKRRSRRDRNFRGGRGGMGGGNPRGFRGFMNGGGGGGYPGGGRESFRGGRGGWGRSFDRQPFGESRGRGRAGGYGGGRDYNSQNNYGNGGYNGNSRFRSRSPTSRGSKRDFHDAKGPGGGYVQREPFNKY